MKESGAAADAAFRHTGRECRVRVT
jgi:hypothetical protein